MEIKILKQSEFHKWDKFLEKHPLSSIFQSSKWGEFQKQIPYRGNFWIIVLCDNGVIKGGTLVIRNRLVKSYTYLYSPRGPVIDYHDPSMAKIQMDGILSVVKKIAKQEKAVFYRIDPLLSPTKFNKENFENGYLPLFTKIHPFNFKVFKSSRHSHQPEETLYLNLSLSEQELLAQMKSKGRYNIRLAAKKGVEVKKVALNDENFCEYMEEFFKILTETFKRDGFSGHPKSYYEKMLKTLDKNAAFYVATHEGDFLTGLISTYWNDTAIYYYGASSNQKRNLMAPYLLQWQVILDAKAAGKKYYDFLGISPQGAKNHPWQGVTDFKLKFGGQRISYQKAQEYVFKPLVYKAYNIAKKLK